MDSFFTIGSGTELTMSVVTLRLLVSLVLSGAIGMERERARQPAGFRTHIIISTGATLLMFVSIYVSAAFATEGGRSDPGRIAAQVVSGIGFLGAGAILKLGADIRGLTTAASLWTAAAIGLAVGAGLVVPAAMVAAIILFTLIVLEKIEDRWFPKHSIKQLQIYTSNNKIQMRDIRKILDDTGIHVRSWNVQHAVRKGHTRFSYMIYLPRDFEYKRLYERLDTLKDVYKIVVDEQGR